MKDAGTIANKWASALGAAGPMITAGVNAVQTSPTAKAAAAIDRQVAGVQAAAASGKTQKALQNVTLQQWQNAMLTKGVPRIASGANGAKPKFQAFIGALMQYQQTGLANLPPRGDFNQNIARMTAWAQYMKNFQKPAGT